MISGITEPEVLCKRTILEKINEGDIFSFYLPDLQVGKTMLSPFRNEQDPSLLVTCREGQYSFRDLADTRYHGDAFDLVAMLHPGMTFMEALQKVNIDFGLGLAGAEQRDYQRIVQALPKHKEKPPSIIEVITRPFTLRELEYWNRHLQSKNDLIANDVYAIGQAFLNDKEIPRWREDELEFAYYFPELDKWKLYYPERSQKEGKWMGSISGMYVERPEQLKGSKKAIIEKSRKDRMVLQKLWPWTCNLQNESNAGFTTEFREFLVENTKDIFIFFDSDPPGVKNSQQVATTYGYKELTLPHYATDKDVAGWVYKEGPYPIVNWLMDKGFS